MNKNIYILFYFIIINFFLIAQDESMVRVEIWHDNFFEKLIDISKAQGVDKDGYISQLYEDIINNLNSEDLTLDEEIYLSIWEIKLLFYNGDIESAINKKNEFESKIKSREYSSLYGLPNFDYIDNPKASFGLKYNSNNCIIKKLKKLNIPSLFEIWHLEILNEAIFKKSFVNLYILIGKNNEQNIEIDSHDESMVIRNKNNYEKVKYSLFPPLTIYDKDDEKPSFDLVIREEILEFEIDIAKRMRIQKLRENKQYPIIFNHRNNELENKFSCKIPNLPIILKKSTTEDDFYKLYIHDSELTFRHSFALNKNPKSINDRVLLIAWNNERWVMQEDFNENLITISIPGQASSEDKRWFSEALKFSIGQDKTMDIENFSNDKRINLRKTQNDYEDISLSKYNSKIKKDSLKWDINSNNFELSDSLLVQRLEIELDSTTNTLNIEVTNNYDNYEDDKKEIRRAKLRFYISLFLAVTALLAY